MKVQFPQTTLSQNTVRRRITMKCYCDARKKYEERVANRVKENANQLVVLGTADFRMMYELLKDADRFHREKWDELSRSYSSKLNMTSSIVKQQDDADVNANIFLEDDTSQNS